MATCAGPRAQSVLHALPVDVQRRQRRARRDGAHRGASHVSCDGAVRPSGDLQRAQHPGPRTWRVHNLPALPAPDRQAAACPRRRLSLRLQLIRDPAYDRQPQSRPDVLDPADGARGAAPSRRRAVAARLHPTDGRAVLDASRLLNRTVGGVRAFGRSNADRRTRRCFQNPARCRRAAAR